MPCGPSIFKPETEDSPDIQSPSSFLILLPSPRNRDTREKSRGQGRARQTYSVKGRIANPSGPADRSVFPRTTHPAAVGPRGMAWFRRRTTTRPSRLPNRAGRRVRKAMGRGGGRGRTGEKLPRPSPWPGELFLPASALGGAAVRPRRAQRPLQAAGPRCSPGATFPVRPPSSQSLDFNTI